MFNNSKEVVIKTFDASASKFDEIGTPFFKQFGKLLSDFSEIQKEDIVLDVACGKGATTFPILQKLSGTGRLYAIDISPKMIKECKQRLTTQNFQNIEFQTIDAENLLFSDNSFDKVVCGFGLFFFPNIEKGLYEIRRVLKQNGLLIFSSWNNEYQLKWYAEILSKYIHDFGSKQQPDPEGIVEQDFRTVEGIEKILRLTNFKKKQITIENIDCFYNNEEEWIETRWHTAHRMLFEKMNTEEYSKFVVDIKDHFRNRKEDEKIKITMSSIITKAEKV
jgi:ubiquinone/menaquinone biosynthesis C-methylase UbiE